jgi:hypothetical protein
MDGFRRVVEIANVEPDQRGGPIERLCDAG